MKEFYICSSVLLFLASCRCVQAVGAPAEDVVLFSKDHEIAGLEKNAQVAEKLEKTRLRVAKPPTGIDELSEQQKVDLVESYESGLEDVATSLKEMYIPMDMFHEAKIIEEKVDEGLDYISTALKEMTEIKALIKSDSIMEGRSLQQGSSNAGGNSNGSSSSNAGGNAKSGRFDRTFQRFAKHPFGSNFPAFDEKFAEKVVRGNGNQKDVFSLFGGASYLANHRAHVKIRARRQLLKDPEGLRRLQQETHLENCKLLVECSKGLSIFDLFIYYLSDDIDPGSGEVDENVKLYDESDIAKKKNSITSLAAAAETASYSLSSCSSLLEQFHRSVEFASNPIWEGAMVAEVCLAEGSQVYVSFAGIASTLFPYLPGLQPKVTKDEFSSSEAAVRARINEVVETAQFSALNKLHDLILDPVYECFDDLWDKGRPMLDPKLFPAGEAYVFASRSVPKSFSPTRSSHGKLTLVEFTSESHDDLNTTYRDCADSVYNDNEEYGPAFEAIISQINGCFPDHPQAQAKCFDEKITTLTNLFNSAMPDYVKQVADECINDYFTAHEKGLKLIFGDEPAPGYVCAVRNAVVDSNLPLPGYCCLDAPFELDSVDWGHEYQCGATCKNPGPFFAGLSPEACDTLGGTFCENFIPCTTLKTCLDQMKTDAESEGQLAFLEYLKTAPQLDDPNKSEQCGEVRSFFGFNAYFNDDETVCKDINQFRFSRNFEFMDSFFDQGTDGGGDDCDGDDCDGVDVTPPPVPPLVLTPPDRTKSKSKPVISGKDWRRIHFGISIVLEGLLAIWNAIKGIACICLSPPLCIEEATCKTIQAILAAGIQLAADIVKIALKLADFLYKELATSTNVLPLISIEDTAVLFANMQSTADYLQERFLGVTDFVNQATDTLEDNLKSVLTNVQDDILNELEGKHNTAIQHTTTKATDITKALTDHVSIKSDEIDTSLSEFEAGVTELINKETSDIDATLSEVTTLINSETDQIDETLANFEDSVTTLVSAETSEIDTALETNHAAVMAQTAFLALNQADIKDLIIAKSSDINATLSEVKNLIKSETDQIDETLANFEDTVTTLISAETTEIDTSLETNHVAIMAQMAFLAANQADIKDLIIAETTQIDKKLDDDALDVTVEDIDAKSVLILSTFRGKPIEATIEFHEFVSKQGTWLPLTLTETILHPAGSLFQFPSASTTHNGDIILVKVVDPNSGAERTLTHKISG